LKLTSGSNNFNDFAENQLPKFHRSLDVNSRGATNEYQLEVVVFKRGVGNSVTKFQVEEDVPTEASKCLATLPLKDFAQRNFVVADFLQEKLRF